MIYCLSIQSAVASSYGIKGIIFYADPKDMGPLFPSTAVRWSSLASLENIHEVQVSMRLLTCSRNAPIVSAF